MKDPTMEKQIEKTIEYLNSPEGREAWNAHAKKGYSLEVNLALAVKKITGVSTYEELTILCVHLLCCWAPARGWAA